MLNGLTPRVTNESVAKERATFEFGPIVEGFWAGKLVNGSQHAREYNSDGDMDLQPQPGLPSRNEQHSVGWASLSTVWFCEMC